MPPVRIGDSVFPSKKALENNVRTMIGAYQIGQIVQGHHAVFLLALFRRHPHADIKIGPGINRITVAAGLYGTKCFHIYRNDGTDTDISWRECLTATPHLQKIKAAFRHLIEPQILSFKQARQQKNTFFCDISGEPLSFTQAHVDHTPPQTFRQLLDDFCAETHTTLDDLQLRNESKDNTFIDELADTRLAREWQIYHGRNATLRLLSIESHKASHHD